MDEHKVPLETLFHLLESSPDGLSSEEAHRRLEQYGSNTLKVKKGTPEFIKFLRQFKNFFALLLMFGGLLAFLAEYLAPGEGNLYIGIALFAVVVLNALFTYIQEHQSERIMESFRKMLPSKITVLRDRKEVSIEVEKLVPGDVLVLQEGDKIPADGRLIEVNSLKVDNSSLTGESEPQLRKLICTHENIMESRNMIFSGTLVQTGNGKALIYGTGMNTHIGKIVRLTKESVDVETPLKKELKHFIRVISFIAIILGIIFFIASIFLGKEFIGSIIFAIGIIVANVPEGLLPTVTLALSMASKRMAKKNALIKNLESVETLGSTTVICTDKTGTITQNRMSVTTLVLNSKEYASYNPDLKKEKGVSVAWATMALCNNAQLKEDNESGGNESGGKESLKVNSYSFIGDPTEGALLIYANQLKPIKQLMNSLPRIHESPFDSLTKRMITTHRTVKKRGRLKNIAYLKGAPEVVIRTCSKMLLDGREVSFTEVKRRHVEEIYHRIASRGERVLALAYKETENEKVKESGFVYIGLVGMLDPPRPEIKNAITNCHTAGIKLIMITGDYGLTAEAIARQVGLYTGNGQVVLGDELAKMDDEELSLLLEEKEIVFARTTPIQKLRIVKALQKKNEIVTVTGDGVNDAPALKNADMGVAMGVCGTDVAKEAADMILMDDNFATIVKAVEEGRTIFENIKKFIAYILTSNIPEIMPFILYVVLNVPLALTVIFILSIDLGTDLLPALGLGAELPESDLMKQPPRKRSERLFTKKLLGISYGIRGMLQATGGFFSFFTILYLGGWRWGQELATLNPLYQKAVTAFFITVVVSQMANVMICRARRQSLFKVGFFSNRLVLLGILVELLFIMAVMYVPFLRPFFGSQPLGFSELLLTLPVFFITIIGDEIRRWFIRHNNKFVINWLSW